MKESLESLFAGFREVSRNRVLLRSVAELFFLVHLTQPTKLRDPVFISAFAIHFPWDFQEVPWNLPNDPKTADTTSLLFGVPRAPPEPRRIWWIFGFSLGKSEIAKHVVPEIRNFILNWPRRSSWIRGGGLNYKLWWFCRTLRDSLICQYWFWLTVLDLQQ
jgi:hypothetical protein